MKYPNIYIIFAWLCLLILNACDSNKVYEDNKTIPDDIWDVKKPVEFDVDIIDTSVLYNGYINIRNASHYPFSNLFVFINTTFPDGTMQEDTLECILADETGKWSGSGMGDIWDNHILMKKGVKFPLSGTYKFSVEQAMREGREAYIEKLPGIMDVGLRIEKYSGEK